MLATIQADLRKQYLNEIEAIQRRVGGDDESWDSLTLDQTKEEIAQLQQKLAATDDLVLDQSDCLVLDQDKNSPNTAGEKEAPLDQEICCPICFEEMITPKQILCCSNGHAICSICIGQIKACPVCRESFQGKDGGKKPKRNFFAERIVSLYMESLKP